MKKIAMIAMLFGFAGAVHADGSCHHPLGCGYMKPDVEEESGWIETKASDDIPMLASDGGYEQCKAQCNNLDWYLQKACFDNCDQKYGGQASAEPTTMIAYDDSQQSDPWGNGGEGGAMLKPESEYDIKLDTDPLCDTDPYSCFHLANQDNTLQSEERQVASLVVLIWIFDTFLD